MKRFICVEGMDLSGKSTVVKNLVEEEKFVPRRYVLTPDNPYYKLAESMNEDGTHTAEELGNMYVQALRHDVATFKRPTEDTVQESSLLLRSFAYHAARETPRIPEILEEIAMEHPKFDKTFILSASMEARKSRLENRIRLGEYVSKEDLIVITDPEKFMIRNRYLIEIARAYFSPETIDTSKMTSRQVTDRVISSIRKLS